MEIKSKFDHFNINVTDVERSIMPFYLKKALGSNSELLPTPHKSHPTPPSPPTAAPPHTQHTPHLSTVTSGETPDFVGTDISPRTHSLLPILRWGERG